MNNKQSSKWKNFVVGGGWISSKVYLIWSNTKWSKKKSSFDPGSVTPLKLRQHQQKKNLNLRNGSVEASLLWHWLRQDKETGNWSIFSFLSSLIKQTILTFKLAIIHFGELSPKSYHKKVYRLLFYQNFNSDCTYSSIKKNVFVLFFGIIVTNTQLSHIIFSHTFERQRPIHTCNIKNICSMLIRKTLPIQGLVLDLAKNNSTLTLAESHLQKILITVFFKSL